MLEGKDYKALDTVFFNAAFIDRCTSYEGSASSTKAHTMYSEIICEVTRKRGEAVRDSELPTVIHKRVQAVERFLVELFDAHCDPGLYILKFHLMDHNFDHIRRFGTLRD